MNAHKPQLYFLLLLLAGTGLLAFFILRPFLYTLIVAAVFAVVFQSAHQRILPYVRGRHSLAALLTILLIVTCIVTPIALLGIQVFKEAQQLYFSVLANGGTDAILTFFQTIRDTIQNRVPGTQFSIDTDQFLKQSLDWLLQYLGAMFFSFTKMALNSFIFFIALYYLLKDGQAVRQTIVALSPLADTDDAVIFSKLERAITSVIKGTLFVAVIQGMLTATGFMLFGVPSPVLWGSIAAVAALIPGIGTALVLVPGIVFLFINSGSLPALGLTIWGILAVGLIDNFLGPRLVGRGVELHPLVILLSVLGGITFFGPIGFLLGPLTVSLLYSLLDIYFSLTKRQVS